MIIPEEIPIEEKIVVEKVVSAPEKIPIEEVGVTSEEIR